LWNVKQEPIADFAAISRNDGVFAAIGLGTCFFRAGFLAVRWPRVVLVVARKLMVDTGRPYLGQTPWCCSFKSGLRARCGGIWFTVSRGGYVNC